MWGKRGWSAGGLILGLVLAGRGYASDPGILILAHGGGERWNETVEEAVSFLETRYPLQIAFGMANPVTLERALELLLAQGVRQVIVIPLFVSSHSSIMDQFAYLLGVSEEKPERPLVMLDREERRAFRPLFTTMETLPSALSWWIREDLPPPEVFRSVVSLYMSTGDSVEAVVSLYARYRTLYRKQAARIQPLDLKGMAVYLAKPMDDHPVIAQIVCERALELSRNPEKEMVILVAHGPNSEERNRQWLHTMESVARQCQAMVRQSRGRGFQGIWSVTVRDDAPEPIYVQAREHLRALVRQSRKMGYEVIVVPFLVAEGRVSASIRQRLEGLSYRWSGKTLLPSRRFRAYLEERVEEGLAYFARLSGKE